MAIVFIGQLEGNAWICVRVHTYHFIVLIIVLAIVKENDNRNTVWQWECIYCKPRFWSSQFIEAVVAPWILNEMILVLSLKVLIQFSNVSTSLCAKENFSHLKNFWTNNFDMLTSFWIMVMLLYISILYVLYFTRNSAEHPNFNQYNSDYQYSVIIIKWSTASCNVTWWVNKCSLVLY